VAEFLRERHYIRHPRCMKRLYASRRQALVDGLAQVGSESLKSRSPLAWPWLSR